MAREVFSALLKKVVADFFDGQDVSAEHFDKKKALAKTALPKPVLATTESLLLFNGIVDVNECMAARQTYEKLQWRTRCCIEAALYVATRARKVY